MIGASPAEIYLRFNEPIAVVMAHVMGPDGHMQESVQARASGSDLVLRPLQALPNGTSTITYRVISADGHPVGGSIIFSVGAETGAAREKHAAAPSPRAAIWLVRAASYASLLFGVGGAFFLTVIGPELGLRRKYRRLHAWWLLPGFIAVPCALGLQGLDLLDAPFSRVAELETWRAAAASSQGVSTFLGMLALLLAGVAVQGRYGRAGSKLAGLAMLLLALAFASTGHAANAEPRWLTRAAVGLHTVAAALWAGALPSLLRLASDRDRGLSPALTRFSRLAIPAVAILVAAGAVLAVIQLGSLAAVTDTAYGRILAGKLAAVALLFGLAAANRLWLSPAIAAGSERAVRRLQLTIRAEIALMALVICLVAAWRFTPPPRAQVSSSSQMHIHGERAMVQITFEPGRVGSNKATLEFLTGDFGPLTPKEVVIAISQPSSGVEPRGSKAVLRTDGKWFADGVYIPAEGTWNVKVDALITDFEKIALTGETAFPR